MGHYRLLLTLVATVLEALDDATTGKEGNNSEFISISPLVTL